MEREQMRQALLTKFDQLSSSLDDLQSRTREMKHEVRAQWESKLAELERQQRAARAKLAEFSSDSSAAWDTFKAGMETTWQSLKQTCEDARKKFN